MAISKDGSIGRYYSTTNPKTRLLYLSILQWQFVDHGSRNSSQRDSHFQSLAGRLNVSVRFYYPLAICVIEIACQYDVSHGVGGGAHVW